MWEKILSKTVFNKLKHHFFFTFYLFLSRLIFSLSNQLFAHDTAGIILKADLTVSLKMDRISEQIKGDCGAFLVLRSNLLMLTIPARPPVAAEMPKKPSLGMIMLSTFVQNS